MENDYLLEVRKIISKNDDSRIDMSMYKTAALITMVKNCDKKCHKCKEENELDYLWMSEEDLKENNLNSLFEPY